MFKKENHQNGLSFGGSTKNKKTNFGGLGFLL